MAEVLVAGSAGFMVLAVLVSTSLTLQRSMAATDHYAKASNDGSRLVDYVVQDLRRALRVGMLISDTHTPLKNNVTFAVDDLKTLTINIPDYYGSNNPDRAADSPFRTPRYARSALNVLSVFNGNGADALNGTIYWKEAVTKIGSVETTRFSPAHLGNGEVQVRYYRAPRSLSDSTVCYFRAEYKSDSETLNFPPQEIAERVATGGDPVNLIIKAPNLPLYDPRYGKIFHIKSSFTPRFRHAATSEVEAEQNLTVVLRNGRRD